MIVGADSILLVICAGLFGLAAVRLRRRIAAMRIERRALEGPQLDPETGMMTARGVAAILGSEFAYAGRRGAQVTVVVGAIHCRNPGRTMALVEQRRRAHEPCLRLSERRFVLALAGDPDVDIAGALARLRRTIEERCGVADLGWATAPRDGDDPWRLVDEAQSWPLAMQRVPAGG